MEDFSLQALHDQIESDPDGLGYKEEGGEWKGDDVIADLINARDFVIDRVSISMRDTRKTAGRFDSYNNLSIDEQEWIRWMTTGSGDFEITDDMKSQLTGRVLTSNGVAGLGDDNQSFWAVVDRDLMAPVMLELIEISGSWAEVLWGEGRIISIGNVGHAANL